MKAIFFKTPGDVAVLEYGEQPTPQAGPGEVLIRVKACALNRIDIWQRSGKYPVPLPHILGSDISGVTESGEEVIVNPALERGHDKPVDIVGFSTQGGYAEFVTVPVNNVHPKPAKLSFEEAAAFPLTALTAWHMLNSRAQLAAGEKVFIWGAAGGLGVMAMQVAKHLGGYVIAGTRDPAKAAALKQLGADAVVVVNQNTVFEPVDVVFETVGAHTWPASFAMLKPAGRLVIAGTTSGNIATLDLQQLYTKQISILGSRMGSAQEFTEVLALLNQGVLRPVLAEVFTLAQAAKAHTAFEAGNIVGKIVLKV